MKVTVNVNKPGTASGLIFVAPYTLYEVEEQYGKKIKICLILRIILDNIVHMV